eukprot:GHRQ01017058.1.p2 GENE.GHRQ01017058.1~~GHRQ01017058.1.p2  ORF type:complete len:140 (+),score=43.60 GHRQ01017058.1:1143-1562(+)
MTSHDNRECNMRTEKTYMDQSNRMLPLHMLAAVNPWTGYTKQVMVIYNGVHYDALAVAASPRADQEDDATEYNPRTRRGKMILAAAQQLVCTCLVKCCHLGWVGQSQLAACQRLLVMEQNIWLRCCSSTTNLQEAAESE